MRISDLVGRFVFASALITFAHQALAASPIVPPPIPPAPTVIAKSPIVPPPIPPAPTVIA
jgi:hypothetical protein